MSESAHTAATSVQTDQSDLSPVSFEKDGRILTGVGVTAESLEETMDRHTPEAPSTDRAPETAIAENKPAISEEVKPTRGQKRFDQLTAEREAEKRRADAAEQERETLRQRLEAVEQAQRAVREPEQTKPETIPEKFRFPTFDAYVATHPDASYEDWNDAKLDAHADWREAKRQNTKAYLDTINEQLDARVRASIEADRASRSLTETLQQTREKARQVYPDFDAMMSSGPGVMVVLGPTPDIGAQRVQAIIEMPGSEHLQYAIAKDEALARRLAGLSDIAFGAELARLVPASPAVAPLASTAASSVIPPAPYVPVGSGSKTTVPPSAELAKKGFDFDASGYREKRAAERGVNRRR